MLLECGGVHVSHQMVTFQYFQIVTTTSKFVVIFYYKDINNVVYSHHAK